MASVIAAVHSWRWSCCLDLSSYDDIIEYFLFIFVPTFREQVLSVIIFNLFVINMSKDFFYPRQVRGVDDSFYYEGKYRVYGDYRMGVEDIAQARSDLLELIETCRASVSENIHDHVGGRQLLVHRAGSWGPNLFFEKPSLYFDEISLDQCRSISDGHLSDRAIESCSLRNDFGKIIVFNYGASRYTLSPFLLSYSEKN